MTKEPWIRSLNDLTKVMILFRNNILARGLLLTL